MPISIENHIMDLEKRAWEANKNRDLEYYRRLLDEKCVAVSPYGTFGKQMILKDIATNPRELLQFDLSDFRFIQLNDTAAILSYQVRTITSLRGIKNTYQFYVSSVYRKNGDLWRSVFFQQTIKQSSS